jgi:hypothetical protein
VTWTLRLVHGGEKSIQMIDTHFDTKREVLSEIRFLGNLSHIKRFGRVYVVQKSKKK